MKLAVLLLSFALIVPAQGLAQPASGFREMRFSGPSAVATLCSCLLDSRRSAEEQGRLDFAVEVESSSRDGSAELTARIRMGSPYAVGRITFVGHSMINDTTIRRALVVFERDVLDVGRLRRSLARLDNLGVFEPLTLADISVVRLADGVTADLTIQLRARKRRWWSVSGSMLPTIGPLQASVSSRLPPWGRGVFEVATYFVSLNVGGFTKPFLALERPVLPGQELLSGFSVTPSLSPRAMLVSYGRRHLGYALGGMLDGRGPDSLTVPVTSSGRLDDEPLVCKPPRGRFWWLRRGAAAAVRIAPLL